MVSHVFSPKHLQNNGEKSEGITIVIFKYLGSNNVARLNRPYEVLALVLVDFYLNICLNGLNARKKNV